MKTASLVMIALAVGLFAGCKSTHEEDVKSNMRTQWTSVAADTMATTNAAKSVLEDMGLHDVKGSSTSVDGMASAKKADGTKVNVEIGKQSDKISKVSVTVGTMGDSSLGAEIAKKIKTKAEGM
jgi:hypothetical protein